MVNPDAGRREPRDASLSDHFRTLYRQPKDLKRSNEDSSCIATAPPGAPPRKDRTMNTSFTARLVAAVAAGATTFVLFSAVTSLAQPHQAAHSVQVAQAPPLNAPR
jgi:hypothetical protein